MDDEEGYEMDLEMSRGGKGGRGGRARGGPTAGDFLEADAPEAMEEEEELYDDDDDDDYEDWGQNDHRMATPACCWAAASVALCSAIAVCLVIFSVELYTLNHPTETATYTEDLVTVILMVVLSSVPLLGFVFLCFCGIVLKIQDIRRRNRRFSTKTKPSRGEEEMQELEMDTLALESSPTVETPQQLEYLDEDPFGAPSAPLAIQEPTVHEREYEEERDYYDDSSEEEEEEFD